MTFSGTSLVQIHLAEEWLAVDLKVDTPWFDGRLKAERAPVVPPQWGRKTRSSAPHRPNIASKPVNGFASALHNGARCAAPVPTSQLQLQKGGAVRVLFRKRTCATLAAALAW